MTRAGIATASGIIGWSLAYTAPAMLHLRNAYYDPVARSWSITEHAGPIPIGYYGQLAYGFVGAVALAVLGTFLAPRLTRIGSLLGGWALTSLGLSFLYFTWHNLP